MSSILGYAQRGLHTGAPKWIGMPPPRVDNSGRPVRRIGGRRGTVLDDVRREVVGRDEAHHEQRVDAQESGNGIPPPSRLRRSRSAKGGAADKAAPSVLSQTISWGLHDELRQEVNRHENHEQHRVSAQEDADGMRRAHLCDRPAQQAI